MNKKIIGIFVVMLLTLTSIPIFGIEATSNIYPSSTIYVDELDQEQLVSNNRENFLYDVGMYKFAQSFVPTLDVLTRVKLILKYNGELSDDCFFTVSIRSSLYATALATTSLRSNQMETQAALVEFDFEDISVNLGETYYIVCESCGEITYNDYICWYWGSGDLYKEGEAKAKGPTGMWRDYDWYEEDVDFCFQTYGRNNLPPNVPVITGSANGKAGVEYEYAFNTVDPDDDAVSYYIEWGDGTNTDWIQDSSAAHVWDEQGTYEIKVKAKDNFDAESDWATLEVAMPKNKEFNPLKQFLEQHPRMFPLLRQMLGLQ